MYRHCTQEPRGQILLSWAPHDMWFVFVMRHDLRIMRMKKVSNLSRCVIRSFVTSGSPIWR